MDGQKEKEKEKENENDISNKEENELINKYKKFEFNNLGEQSQEYLFDLTEFGKEDLYLISKTDFDKGISYLHELSNLEDDKKNNYKSRNKKSNINIYTKINEVKGKNSKKIDYFC
jgi:hypothetical protein